MRPGPRNLITDVAGIAVGNAEDGPGRSGVTVVLPAAPAVAAVDVRGGAPGTRETDLLQPANMVDTVHGVALSGGSAFGLDAASGVVDWLRRDGRGRSVGRDGVLVPIVPAAILFDLANGGDKTWPDGPPYRALGSAACDAAGADFTLGNAGAGLGAVAGPVKGGLGSVSAVADDGLAVGAVVAVNAIGSPIMPGQAALWAWAWEQAGEMGGQPLPTGSVDMTVTLKATGGGPDAVANTTIGVVATNAALTKPEAHRVCIMAQDGFARAIRPAHTPFDGDTLFCLATGAWTPPGDDGVWLAHLGAVAADCVARAIGRGIFEAADLGGIASYRTQHGHALGRS